LNILSSRGFVLASTLWILAAITLSASFFALWVHRAIEGVWQSERELQGEIDMMGSRSVLLYLLATQRITRAGLVVPEQVDRGKIKLDDNYEQFGEQAFPVGVEIPLDDRGFNGVGKSRFSIQDEGGLITINLFDTQYLSSLLGLLGVPLQERGPMIDKLLDFMDDDDLARLNGAEEKEYAKLGMPAPPNRGLLTSWEIARVLGWDKYPGIFKDCAITRLTTIRSGGMPNFNTAPALVLKSIPGIDEDTAKLIIKAREKMPFSSFEDVSLAIRKTLPIEGMGVKLMAAKWLRISLWYEGSRHTLETHLTLTPKTGHSAPWLIDYELFIPLSLENHEISSRIFSFAGFAAPLSAQ